LRSVYYASTKEDAAKIGFDDQFIYEQLSLPMEQRKIPMKRLILNESNMPFETWENTNDKVDY
jgi:guanine deaminase